MPSIKVRPDEPIDSCIRRFRRSVDKSGLQSAIRAKEYFIKETTKRKEALNNAKKRSIKMQKKAQNQFRSGSRSRSRPS